MAAVIKVIDETPTTASLKTLHDIRARATGVPTVMVKCSVGKQENRIFMIVIRGKNMYLFFEIVVLIMMAIAFKVIMSKRAQIRGFLGEKKVRQQLDKVILENYRVLNDIMIKTEKGTSQIDHMAISPYGFLII